MPNIAELWIPTPARGEALLLRRAGLLRDSVILLLLPLALLAIDPRWIYSSVYRDSWIYFGYFQDAPLFAREFANQYFSSRLSVILPGYLFERLLPSEPANHLLHLLYFWVALLSFYGVCALRLDRRRGLLAALAFGCHPFFLYAIGSNYVDGFGIAYFLAILFLLAVAVRARPRLRAVCLVAAGAGATALVTANLFYVIYLPCLAAFFWFADSPDAGRRLGSALGLTLAGAAGLFLAFGAANRLMGGPFFYLGSSLGFARGALGTANPFRDPTYAWLPDATRLVVPALILAGGAAVLARRREADPARRRFAVFAQLQLLGLAGLLVFLQVKGGMAVLQHAYYVSLLLPAVFLAFAAQLPAGLAGLSPRAWALLAGAAALLLGLSHALAFAPGSVVSWRQDLPVLAPLVAGCLLAVLTWPSLWPGGAAVRASLMVAALAACQTLAWDGAQSPRGFDRRYGGDARGFFLQVSRASELIRSRNPELDLRLWYKISSEDPDLLADMVSSTYLVCPSMVGGNFPALLFGAKMCDGKPLLPGQRIAVLSTDPAAFAQAGRSLRDVGLAARFLERQEVAGPVRGFAVTFLEAVRADGTP